MEVCSEWPFCFFFVILRMVDGGFMGAFGLWFVFYEEWRGFLGGFFFLFLFGGRGAIIRIPTNINHLGGFFRAHLLFPPEYPHLPPKMIFQTPLFHPNSTSPPLPTPSSSSLTLTQPPLPIKSTHPAKYASQSSTHRKKTDSGTNPPPSAGLPSRPPKPSC